MKTIILARSRQLRHQMYVLSNRMTKISDESETFPPTIYFRRRGGRSETKYLGCEEVGGEKNDEKHEQGNCGRNTRCSFGS
jgi:hypothetical protein